MGPRVLLSQEHCTTSRCRHLSRCIPPPSQHLDPSAHTRLHGTAGCGAQGSDAHACTSHVSSCWLDQALESQFFCAKSAASFGAKLPAHSSGDQQHNHSSGKQVLPILHEIRAANENKHFCHRLRWSITVALASPECFA